MEIDFGFFRVYGPYFIGKSLGTFKILIFGLWSFIPHPSGEIQTGWNSRGGWGTVVTIDSRDSDSCDNDRSDSDRYHCDSCYSDSNESDGSDSYSSESSDSDSSDSDRSDSESSNSDSSYS